MRIQEPKSERLKQNKHECRYGKVHEERRREGCLDKQHVVLSQMKREIPGSCTLKDGVDQREHRDKACDYIVDTKVAGSKFLQHNPCGKETKSHNHQLANIKESCVLEYAFIVFLHKES